MHALVPSQDPQKELKMGFSNGENSKNRPDHCTVELSLQYRSN